jgi:lysylphosphatidylglycerol synthetase-like protein (DUF2156 family)
MKTQRILSISWLAVCGYIGLRQFGQLCHVLGDWSSFTVTPVFYWVTFETLMYLAGLVACLYLFRGAQWARMFMGGVAVVTMIWSICILILSQFHFWRLGVIAVFAVISAVLLFSPRREAVA